MVNLHGVKKTFEESWKFCMNTLDILYKAYWGVFDYGANEISMCFT